MAKIFIVFFSCVFLSLNIQAQDTAYLHPATNGNEWTKLFKDDLSNAIFPKGVWSEADGIITATKDEALWSEKEYDDFVLDLDFKNADGTNSGVIVHASNIEEWVPHSVEIQIADDYSEQWSKAAPDWQCAAIFGH